LDKLQRSAHENDLSSIRITLVLYILVFAMKLAVYFVTGVMALLAEALHTLCDILISGFLLLAIALSRRQADKVHMFGYGRAQNVAALVAATLFLSFTSYKLYEEAIPRLVNPAESAYQNLPLALGVIIVSIIIAAFPFVKMLRQKKRGAAAKAQLRELVNDELALVAALVGTLFIIWGMPLADPIATIIVATIIAINAIGLFRENASYLLGRSLAPEIQGQIENLACSVPGVISVHELRSEYIGPETVHVEMHVVVSRGTPVEEADVITKKIRSLIHKYVSEYYCVIHVDPSKSDEAPKDGFIDHQSQK